MISFDSRFIYCLQNITDNTWNDRDYKKIKAKIT